MLHVYIIYTEEKRKKEDTTVCAYEMKMKIAIDSIWRSTARNGRPY